MATVRVRPVYTKSGRFAGLSEHRDGVSISIQGELKQYSVSEFEQKFGRWSRLMVQTFQMNTDLVRDLLLEKFLPHMQAQTKLMFSSKIGSDDQPWKELSHTRERIRRKAGTWNSSSPRANILRESGKLRDSMGILNFRMSPALATMSYGTPDKEKLRLNEGFWTMNQYGPITQLAWVPPRPFIGIQRATLNKLFNHLVPFMRQLTSAFKQRARM